MVLEGRYTSSTFSFNEDKLFELTIFCIFCIITRLKRNQSVCTVILRKKDSTLNLIWFIACFVVLLYTIFIVGPLIDMIITNSKYMSLAKLHRTRTVERTIFFEIGWACVLDDENALINICCNNTFTPVARNCKNRNKNVC